MLRFRTVLRNEAGDGDGGGGDPIFDDAPAPPKNKLDGALPPKPVKAKEEPKPEPKAKPKTQHERRKGNDDITEELEKHLASERAKEADKEKAERKAAKPKDDKPEPKPEGKLKPREDSDDEGDKPAKPEAKAPERKAAEPDKPEPAKPDAQLEQRLLRATQDLRSSETVQKQLKSQLEQATLKAQQAEKKAQQLEAKFSRAKDKKQAYDFFVESTGLTFKDLVDGLEKGEIEPARTRASLPPELEEKLEKQQAELERLRKVEEERETRAKQEAEQVERKRQYDEHLGQVKTWIADNLDDFPVLARIEWAATTVLNGAYRNNGQFDTPAKTLQDSILGDFTKLLDDEKAVDLIDRKLTDATRARLAKKWGMTVAEEPEEVEEEEEDEEEDEKPARVAVKPHVRKPATRVASESAPSPKAKKMNRFERAEYANTLLERRLREERQKLQAR